MPVGNGVDRDTFWIVTEHRRNAGYVRNIERTARVRAKFRHGLLLRWRTGTAQLLPRERQRALGRGHPLRALNALSVRALGTELLTIRIDLDRVETQRVAAE